MFLVIETIYYKPAEGALLNSKDYYYLHKTMEGAKQFISEKADIDLGAIDLAFNRHQELRFDNSNYKIEELEVHE